MVSARPNVPCAPTGYGAARTRCPYWRFLAVRTLAGRCRRVASISLKVVNLIAYRIMFASRILGGRSPRPGPRHPLRGVQEQEMGVQLERERAGADHVQVLGTLRRPQEVAHRQGGVVSVQEHVPVGK